MKIKTAGIEKQKMNIYPVENRSEGIEK